MEITTTADNSGNQRIESGRYEYEEIQKQEQEQRTRLVKNGSIEDIK